MTTILEQFQIQGKPVSTERFGCGHINETYLCVCDSGLRYVLQKINKTVFRCPEQLMENIAAVTAFIAEKNNDPRADLRVIPTLDGCNWLLDADGEYWRLYNYIEDTICLQKAEDAHDFYNTGLAFGRFQGWLADFPAEKLHEPIKNFHNTKDRYRQFHEALEQNKAGRAQECAKEIEFVRAHEAEAGTLVDMLASGELPLRVTHNDTKLNNILLDEVTHDPVCVIDLDTVMPGSALYDYGDSIRFGASTAAEDEKDLDKVWCDMELFRTYTEGFFAGSCGRLTPKEVEMLPMGAKMMTLECGVRFLADYLNGDVYFHIHYPEQNLDRARTQFKLVADMESKWQTMHQIVKEVAEKSFTDRKTTELNG